MNNKVSIITLSALLMLPVSLFAKEDTAKPTKVAKLAVIETIEITAPRDKVWAIVKDWDGLHTWHPAFSADVLTRGKNNTPMTVRTVTLKDSGASFDETLDEFDAKRMYYNYRIIGDSPLPVTHYTANISVKSGETKATSILTWQGSFKRKTLVDPPPGEDDEGVKKFISGAYRAGLDNVKKIAETK
jgi:hypothetical protein